MQSDTVEIEEVVEAPSFADLGLLKSVVKAVNESGYETPTKIQSDAIPVLLAGKDLIAGSQTGTGKTAAFALPTITRLRSHVKTGPRCLVLEPTRELAIQVYEQFLKYAKYTKLRVALLHGGVKYDQQEKQLGNEPDIIIATPGRLQDHLEQKNLSLSKVKILILDESDRMLDMGFLPDVKKLIKLCPSKGRQGLLFSATLPPQIERLSQTMLTDPETIFVGGSNTTASTVSHCIYPVDDRQKFSLLCSILNQLDFNSIIIFSRTKAGADMIHHWLQKQGHTTVVLHSNKTQAARQKALKDFKSGKCEILVATDIVARGIDISDISHVINYDIPQHCEDYVHRIGRTGRANSEGDAITLYTAGEKDFLQSIENFIGQPIKKETLEGFDYKWSPVFDDGAKPKKKKRNRGFNTKNNFNWRR